MSFELTAAAIGVAYAGTSEEMPASLRGRTAADGECPIENVAERCAAPVTAIVAEPSRTGWFCCGVVVFKA